MIPALVLSLFVAATPSEQATAARFCQALTSTEARALLPFVSKPSELSSESWSSVRDLFERYDCISIPSHRVQRDGDWLVLELDGTGVTRNGRHERKSIPVVWYLKTTSNGIVEVKTEPARVADELIAAKDDDARVAIIEAHAEILPAVARLMLGLRAERIARGRRRRRSRCSSGASATTTLRPRRTPCARWRDSPDTWTTTTPPYRVF